MKFSYDAKLYAAMLARVGLTLPPDSCWAEVDALIAAAPAGDTAPAAPTAQTAEPTEEEWEKAWDAIQCRPFATYPQRMTAEAHRLAALRVKGEKA